MAKSPGQRLFELCCQPQEGSLVAVGCHQLHAYRQPLARLSQRQAYCWLPCHVEERSKGDQREHFVEPAPGIKARIVLVERPQPRGWSSDSRSHQHIVGAEERAHASGDGIAESQRPKQIHCRESASVFHAGKRHRLEHIRAYLNPTGASKAKSTISDRCRPDREVGIDEAFPIYLWAGFLYIVTHRD